MLSRLRATIRGRPRTFLLVFAALALLLTAGGGYAYAWSQWQSAQVALKTGRLPQAQSSIRCCLWVWPRSVPVHLAAARVSRLTGDLASAEEHLNRCLQLQRGATEAIQLEFFLLRVQQGEIDEVAPGLWNCIEGNHPETPLILETLARAYMHNLRYGYALICLDRWIKLIPDSAPAHDWRGWVLDRMNNPTEAIKEYSKVLELEPGRVAVRLKVAELLLGKSQVKEALPHLEYLEKHAGDRPEVMARLGQARLLLGRHEDARKLLEAAHRQLPDDALLLIHLARLELHDGRQPARAEELLRRVLKADPADVEAQYTLITALQLQGRADEAAKVAQRYQATRALLERANRLLKEDAEKPSTDPAPAFDLGNSLLQIGQERLGLYWLHQALDRNPSHQPTHRALAAFYESKGDDQKAAAHRRRLPAAQ